MNYIQVILVNLLVLLAVGFAEPFDETTTESPTTFESSTTASSPAPETTPSAPPSTTTKSPDPPLPESGTWNITEGNVTCIRAELQIGVTVDLGEEKLNFTLSPKASDSGSSCTLSNTTQQLVLSYDDYTLTFLFEKNEDNAYVSNLTFVYSSPSGEQLFYDDTKLFKVRTGNSYLCKTAEDIKMQNATMHMYKIHILSFANADEEGFGITQECEADDIVNDTIVIAVACALAGLIIIVLVAYLIGRRRSRQRGYTSV